VPAEKIPPTELKPAWSESEAMMRKCMTARTETLVDCAFSPNGQGRQGCVGPIFPSGRSTRENPPWRFQLVGFGGVGEGHYLEGLMKILGVKIASYVTFLGITASGLK